MKAWLAQTRTELALSLRQGEQLLVSIGIPVLVLVFFSLVDVLPKGELASAVTPTDLGGLGSDLRSVDTLFPRVLALAVMSSAMVSLGIGTGFERYYGVLKRLGVTPLGRPRLLAAKISMVFVIEVLQLVLLTGVAYALGWRADRFGAAPASQVLLTLAAFVLGTAAFAGLGLLLAGTLRGPLNLAVCNGLYLLLLLFGGIAVPLSRIPGGDAARLLPSGALAEVLTYAVTLGSAAPTGAWLVLLGWAIALPVAAARWFRWE